MNVTGINFISCYFRGVDLRGIDFNQSFLNGASIASAKISGCLFPADIGASEFSAFIEHSIRMRVRG